MCLKLFIGDGDDRDIKNTYTISGFQSTEVQLVYRTELHVAVNEYPEKFLKSCVFYFLRSTKGEIVFQYYYSKVL